MRAGRLSRLLVIAGALLLSTFPDARAQSLDPYGGYTDIPAPGGATGLFRVEKIGDRWVFVSPAGNAFWMRGVFNVTPDQSIDDMGNSYANRIITKYGTIANWGTQTALRLKSWGFNALSEYSDWRVWGKIPSVHILNTAGYTLTNRWSLASSATRELISATGAAYSGYRGGAFPDVFAPQFQAYVRKFILDDYPGIRGLYGTPWLIGVSTDDRDYLYGFGPGNEIPSSITCVHLGWIVLVANPSATSQAVALGIGTVTYADPALYSKLALRDFLKAKYGTISGLNAAWGSTYSTFDSAGGWGVGTGLLDENGAQGHAWVPSDHIGLSNGSPTTKADLDAFLYQLAKRYFTVMSTEIRAVAGQHLVFGPATLNSDGLTRRQILQAAAEVVDVIQASIETQAALDLTARYVGDRPLVTWEGLVANPDSAFFRYPQPIASWTAANQSARGQSYADALSARVNFTGANGSKPIAGIAYWEFHDNWREKNSWGLVTLSDNAYDGREAVSATGSDPWGYRTGGEERNYGDFLSHAAAAHAAVPGALRSPSVGSNVPLTVAILAPSTGTTVQQTVVVTANASANASRVDLLLDGTIAAAIGSPRASYSWNTLASKNGSHRWHAKAYDATGQVVTSTPIDVVVSNPVTANPGTLAVSLTRPLDLATVPRKTQVTIAASVAATGVTVARVEFYVNASLKCTATAVPYTCQWHVGGAPGRPRLLQAKAYSTNGIVASSNIVTVTTK